MVDDVNAKLERIERHLKGLVERSLRLTYTKRGAAELLSVGLTTIGGMVKRGEIATARVGGRRMIPVSELLRIATPEQAKALNALRAPKKRVKGEPASAMATGVAGAARGRAALKRRR